jgi:hypothetical protein
LFQPPLELFAPPTLWQISAEHGNGGLECRAPEKPGVIMARLMAIGTIDSASEALGKMAEWKRVACVQLYLEVRLPPVGGK